MRWGGAKAGCPESFALAAQRLPAGEPLDWLTNPFPKEWLLNGEKRVLSGRDDKDEGKPWKAILELNLLIS